MRFARSAFRIGAVVALGAALAACGSSGPKTVKEDGGFRLFGGGKQSGGPAEIGVNSYLWRAALDVVKFMPLASADADGGVIITDWYSPPETPGERFKVTVYILGRQLRSDGVRISVFRQVRQGANWVDAVVAPATGAELEDRVLARARELRSQSSAAR